MPSGRFSIFSRDQLSALARWVVLAVLVTVPLLLVPQLLLGREPGFFLPAEFGHGIGIVDAAPVPSAPVPATPPARRRSAHASSSTSTSTSTSTNLASLASRRLVPVVTAACSSCRVTRNAANGAIRVTLGGAKRTTPGSAFALLDFGGLAGAAGVVRVHDRIGLDRGQRLESDLSVLQVTDVDNRIAYRLQVDRSTRLLRLLSPPGGLSRRGLDISTGTIVPNDGVRTLAVDVAAQAGASIIVRINGHTVISKNDLAGGDARKQRYLAVGILNTPAGFATMSVTHEELQVDVSSANGATQAGVSGTDLPLASAVTLVPPANVGAPTINGTMVTGETLTADVGSWTAANSVRVRWSRCAGDGSGCQPIPDATGTSYVTDSGDAGASFVINVTAVNAAGTAQAASASTPVVANFKPVNVTLPSTAGTPKQGSDLTASAGAWQWRNGSFTYAWQRCDASGSSCATVAGQTSATYTLGYPDVGSTIRVLVTAPGIDGLDGRRRSGDRGRAAHDSRQCQCTDGVGQRRNGRGAHRDGRRLDGSVGVVPLLVGALYRRRRVRTDPGDECRRPTASGSRISAARCGSPSRRRTRPARATHRPARRRPSRSAALPTPSCRRSSAIRSSGRRCR